MTPADKAPSRRSRRPRLATSSLAVLVAIAARVFAQTPQPPPTFQAGVEVIRLSLSVTDGHNRLISGLSEGDLAVYEDGVRQDVSFFTREPLPLSVALLVDGSASMEEKLPVAQEAGVRFVATLRPGDLAQVVQFNDRTTILQDFTTDHAALVAALRRTQPSGSTVLYTALYIALKQMRSQGNPEAPRRRAIVLLTDGEDTASTVDDEQVLELARQADVGVYVIALRGEHALDRQRLAFAQATYFLTAVTRDTGGEAYFPSELSELNAVYGRIADELRSQYTVGYVSGNDRRDGKWRRIVVRARARGDLRVRHKLGYYAAKG
jgi:Ca-activated chloride channel family protein